MHVVRHDDCRMKPNPSAMVVQAMLQCKVASLWRELQWLQGAESHKQRAIIALIMRKTAAIFVAAESCVRQDRASVSIVRLPVGSLTAWAQIFPG